MITVCEDKGYCGFGVEEVEVLKKYMDIKKYKENDTYFVLSFNYNDELRHSFYIKHGDTFVRAFSSHHMLQPTASININDGSSTGKYGKKQLYSMTIQGIQYVSDNFHPLYINQFKEQ
jgi:hypothetical protein